MFGSVFVIPKKVDIFPQIKVNKCLANYLPSKCVALVRYSANSSINLYNYLAFTKYHMCIAVLKAGLHMHYLPSNEYFPSSEYFVGILGLNDIPAL